MWGFITCLNDILIPHLKAVFDLTYVQAMLVQFCFFGAYFLMSLPSGYIVKKLGYKKGSCTDSAFCAGVKKASDAESNIKKAPNVGATVVPSALNACVSVKRDDAVLGEPNKLT